MPTIAKVRCLCGGYEEHVTSPARLPWQVTTCSCNICRYCTGALFAMGFPLESQPPNLSLLQRYDSSARLNRYFCGQCGSHLFHYNGTHGAWNVCSGSVDRIVGAEQGYVAVSRTIQHEFVGDTIDGGLAICLPGPKDKPRPMYLQGPDEKPVSIEMFEPRMKDADSQSGQHQATELHAGCHCGQVRFTITRPNHLSKTCSSPWPDLILPYHSNDGSNPEDVKWWLRANGTKFLAGTCSCRSCRRGSGCSIQPWAFVPKVNIRKSDGSEMDFNIKGMKSIESSRGNYREICSVCGATVFWHCDERPGVVDVSVGLLRANEGSRAETWLEWWTKRVSFQEEAFETDLVQELYDNLGKLNQAML